MVLTVAALDIGPFAMLPDIATSVFLAVSLLVSAAAHHSYYRNIHIVGGDEKPPELRRE